ncbi:MAG: hypothetical protein BJ554DRAFT_7605, partial [Olpidium bornovanus]
MQPGVVSPPLDGHGLIEATVSAPAITGKADFYPGADRAAAADPGPSRNFSKVSRSPPELACQPKNQKHAHAVRTAACTPTALGRMVTPEPSPRPDLRCRAAGEEEGGACRGGGRMAALIPRRMNAHDGAAERLRQTNHSQRTTGRRLTLAPVVSTGRATSDARR